MKNYTATRSSFIILVSLFISSVTFGSTYITINDGAWDDESDVWSTNGIAPCNCTPGRSSNGNDIIINNDILTSYDVIINNSHLTVSKSGSLKGNYSATTANAVINLRGEIELAQYTQESNTIFNLTEGASFYLNSSCTILGGRVTLSESTMNLSSGNLKVSAAASLIVERNSTLMLEFGEILNEGNIYNDADCYIDGNIQNSSMSAKLQ